MPSGVVVLESLRSPEVLDRVAIAQKATFTVEPAPGQPSVWTLVEFDLVDADPLRLAIDLHKSLLPGP